MKTLSTSTWKSVGFVVLCFSTTLQVSDKILLYQILNANIQIRQIRQIPDWKVWKAAQNDVLFTKYCV